MNCNAVFVVNSIPLSDIQTSSTPQIDSLNKQPRKLMAH